MLKTKLPLLSNIIKRAQSSARPEIWPIREAGKCCVACRPAHSGGARKIRHPAGTNEMRTLRSLRPGRVAVSLEPI